MPGMRDQFAHFYVPDEDAIATAMKTGLVVPDTNVVLNLYRFQATARDELFGTLGKLGDRLWIPYHVGFEFHRNRLGVMKEQEGYFAKTRDEVLGAVDGLHAKVRAFGNRLGLSAEQTKGIDDGISTLNGLIADVVLKAEGLNEIWLSRHASDAVLARIDALFDNRVGAPMKPKELDDARKEAERRIREKLPPGYKDRGKDDPTGDYIVWRQIMTEAASRKLPVVFITDDSRSDDWYRREHGLTLGARHELREEMMREAGVPLLLMTTATFLRHAKTYLDATVSDETVDQAKELPSAARQDSRRSSEFAQARSLAYEYRVTAVLTELGYHVLQSVADFGFDLIIQHPDGSRLVMAELKYYSDVMSRKAVDAVIDRFGHTSAPALLISNVDLTVAAQAAVIESESLTAVRWRDEADTSELAAVLEQLFA